MARELMSDYAQKTLRIPAATQAVVGYEMETECGPTSW